MPTAKSDVNTYSFDELIDIFCLEQLLKAHHRLSRLSYSLFSADQRLLIAVGWQDICVRFHQSSPDCSARCKESREFIACRMYAYEDKTVECRCLNGMINISMPIIIEGKLMALFSVGQFFYEDDKPSPTFFQAQADRFGFESTAYLRALDKVPVLQRSHAHDNIHFLRNMVNLLARKGWNMLNLARLVEERHKAEQALAASERHFRTLTEHSPDAIARYDRECRRLYINPALHSLFNVPVEELLGKRPAELSPVSDPVLFEQMIHESLQSGHVCQQEFVFQPAPGTTKLAMITAVPEFDEDGKVESVLMVGRDISMLNRVQHTLQLREQHLRTLAETLPGVLFTLRLEIDGSLSMPYVSPRIRELSGIESKKLAADLQLFFSHLHPDDQETVRSSLAGAVGRLESWYQEFRWQHPEKGTIWVEARATPTFEPDGGSLWHGYFHDISAHKQIEQELFAARKLEIIGQLAGGVAHEVRNPLNAILSITEALFREKEIVEQKKFAPYIRHIRSQIDRLSKLMRDLLDLGKPHEPTCLQTIHLEEFCLETIALWQLTEEAQHHPVTFTGLQGKQLCTVQADALRLQQALLNLLANAAQNSPGGTGISIVVHYVEQYIALHTRDAGQGISQENLARVFEPFFTLRRGGTGLGLALVKQSIESMGGQVRLLRNQPPPGCTAEILLPLDRDRRAVNAFKNIAD